MSPQPGIAIEMTDPRRTDVRRLVAELDAYMQGLYPAESNHLVDVESLAAPEVRFFTVRVEGELMGCAAIMLREESAEEPYAEVKRVYVSPRGRGLGLGKRLLSRLEEETRTAGLALMRLETGIYQPEALGLFAAFGFDRCGPFGDYPVDDPHSVFMAKRL